MSIVKDYLDLTLKWKNELGEKTLVLMQVGSFFEVYALINPDGTYTGSNIEDFARINDMAIAKKNICVGKLPVAMAGFGVPYIDKHLQKLQEHSYTIVIYQQTGSEKNITRTLAEIISPGTFFPSETTQLSNNIMCIWLHKSNATKYADCQVTLGISNIDIYTGKTSLFQFSASYLHSPSTYDELERYISAYRPSECLFVANMPDRLIDDIIGFVGLEQAKIHKVNLQKNTPTTALTTAPTKNETFAKNAEKQIYQREILNRFFPTMAFSETFPTTHYIATQAFCFLLDFVYQHSPNLVSKLSEPVFENYTDRLILANHSLQQLNIIDDTRHTGRLRSVCSLLNHCVTTMGKRQFIYQLHYPTTNATTLQAAYDITDHLLTTPWMNIRQHLSTIIDLEKLTRKMITRKVMPKNLVNLVEDLTHIEALYNETQTDVVLGAYLPSKSINIACREIIADVQRVFSLDACRDVTEFNEGINIINRGISSTLDDLHQSSLDGRAKLEAICNYFSDLVKTTEKKTLTQTQYIKIHETAKSDAILIGTKRRVDAIKTILKKNNTASVILSYQSTFSQQMETFELYLQSLDYIINGSNKKDLVITSPQIKTLTTTNRQDDDKRIKVIQEVFQNYVTEFSKFESVLQDIIHYTTQMDILQCKCYIVDKYNYCKPVIAITNTSTSTSASEKSTLAFTGIRHPLIEQLQTNEIYVTNDLSLGAANESNGILLYGTNAVGKTSFIKSIGIAVILAQAGLYVPCETFTFKPYQTIFTRILGNDNLFKGLSTFAVEMTELRTILTMANKYSLVLGDELCSGTESDSALSIFTAGLEMLYAKESTFLFATHFHEITKYEEIKALTKLRMMHMAVHYNQENNSLVYDRKLREGSGESMYGLEVCKSLHLPDAFLQRAHDIRMKYRPESQNILSLSPTHFNAKKLVGNCELCHTQKASEVHHLQHQKHAKDQNDYIINSEKQAFHKNHVANLLNICEDCHQKIHQTGRQHKIVKTTRGYILKSI